MADEPKSKDDLTPDEVNRYWSLYFAVIDTLVVAQGMLQELEDKATDLGERSGYRADRLRVEADIELMRSRRLAFNANQARIKPPDQALVDHVVQRSKEVSKLTVNRNQAAAITTITASALEEFGKIQKS